MNDWARHYGDEYGRALERRIYRSEFAEALGYSLSWFRTLEKRGAIPRGRRDPGGKRLWWPESQARATIAKLNESAEQAVKAREGATP